MREKITCYAEKLILAVSKRSVGKSIPFSMHKVKKPENFAELVKKVEQEEDERKS